MARKPSDTAQLKLRIREDLRRRLERAARKRAVSLNFEMTDRLKESFDREAQRTIDAVGSDIAGHWARFGGAWHELNKQGDLVRASTALIEQLPAEVQEREAIKKAVAQVKKIIRLIEHEAALMIRGMSTGGGLS